MSESQHPIISVEPGKRGRKPCIRGMRISVYDLLSYLAAGMTAGEILADFPYLTEEDIRACLAFAADRGARPRSDGRSAIPLLTRSSSTSTDVSGMLNRIPARP